MGSNLAFQRGQLVLSFGTVDYSPKVEEHRMRYLPEYRVLTIDYRLIQLQMDVGEGSLYV